MTELEDANNEISSHEWESNLAKIICGSLLSLNELIEDISDEDLHERLSDQNRFCIFECFFEPLLYYKNKHNLPPNLPKSNDESVEGKFILKNPLYSESENKDLSELFRFGKTPKVSIQELFGFVLSVLHLGGFNVSSFVLSVINMAKLVESIKIPICQHNWRPIFITSLILSDKLWDDSCAKSGDLARTIGFISPNSLKYLELIFCEQLDWKITFKLDTIKNFISKIVNSELDSELIQRVISSETYQSYCYEGIHDTNTQTKHEICAEEKLENKNMMNSVNSSELININKQKLCQKSNQNMNNYQKRSESPLFFNNQNQNPRMLPNSLLKQPQLQKGMSFHGNQHPFNAQFTSSTFISNPNTTSTTPVSQIIGNQIAASMNFSGVHQHHTNHPNSNMKRPSAPIARLSGGYSTLNRSFYSPAKSQISINNNNGNFVHGSSLSLKSHIASLMSPKSNLTNKTQQYAGLSTTGQTPSSKASASRRSSASENFPSSGNHARSSTPDVITNSSSSFNHLNVSSLNERGRDTSCLSNLKQSASSHIATRMNSNPNILEQKPSKHFRYSNAIKRSSSEHSRLNLANSQGNQNTMQQLSRPLHVPQLRRGGGDGFFSMARNKVSSAFSSITRTFGLSSVHSNNINENNSQESNIAPANSNQINPTNELNKVELKSPLLEPPSSSSPTQKIEPNSNHHFNQQNRIKECASPSNSNQRNLSMPPKSNPVLSQLSENQQKSALLSSINVTVLGSAAKSGSETEKKPVPIQRECNLRALSTDRAYNGNHPFLRQSFGSDGYRHKAFGNGISSSIHLTEKQPTLPLSAAWAPNYSSIRAPQTALHNVPSVSDRLGGNMHADSRRHSVGRGASQVKNMTSKNHSSISNGFFGRAVGTGSGLARNISLVGRTVHSQGSTTGDGLIGSFFGGKYRMQSSSPSSNSTNTGFRSALFQPNNPKGATFSSSSIFSVESLINPISNFLKGKSPSAVSSSMAIKAPGTQIGSVPISGIGLSIGR
ncbi:cyclin [Cryptosporidium sp. chipmunk genotype I]|uniref:cyclin n=1 Tax=Cryptosporidium sp. chipmunk genotype I TaxID=1280935 RepID=UPI00351A4DA5|nr:cyclin [Cryptosporidium sp. chipmunk genotype I]